MSFSITISAVGKLRPQSPEHLLITEYKKRLPWELYLKEVEEKKPLPDLKRKEREAELLLQTLPQNTHLIALDAKGKTFDSEAFAAQLAKLQSTHTTLAFAIGGAVGHGDILLERANSRLSLGLMTWPHMLVRVMLVEQLYRAFTLLTGHPYHK